MVEPIDEDRINGFVMDINWLEGYGLDTEEARDFIVSTLRKGKEISKETFDAINEMTLKEINDYEVN
ncbi:MAG: hypothetical protein WC307_06465 [Candidatus Nanoarchaeia archaeon]|jgi:hypothetical protein